MILYYKALSHGQIEYSPWAGADYTDRQKLTLFKWFLLNFSQIYFKVLE